ncbi:MAG: hypothetical protein F7B17_00225 [Desulfurococcales archaeon]|nr:hypothetical protein [Desulfurococcales archaeon]
MAGRGYDREEALRKMTRLMMQGAVMLGETCPLDGLPLFRLKSGEVVCPVHGRVLIVSTDEEAREAEIEGIIREVRYRAARNVLESLEEGDPKRIKEWLDVIESTERILSLRKPLESREEGEARSKAGKK